MDNIQKFIHKTTARICNDVERPPPDELTEPQPIRRCARLVAITAVGALLLVAIVVMAMRTPKIQSEKKTLPSDDPTVDVKKLLRDAQDKVGQGINCVCQNQAISWCYPTTFHIYSNAHKGASAPNKTFDLNDDEGGEILRQICNQKNEQQIEICMQILGPVFNSKDSRTYLPTASVLTDPGLLDEEIATRMDTNAVEQSNVYSLLKVTNDMSDFNYSQSLIYLVRDMQSQFLKNKSSSSQDYWIASNDTRAMYNVTFSFGMDVSWDKYLKVCKPAFCDIQYPVSVLNRVIRAAAQVGGITTVVALALQFLIWPALRVALHFPASKPPPPG